MRSVSPRRLPVWLPFMLCAGLNSAAPALATSWIDPPLVPDVVVQDQDGRSLNFYRDLLQGRTVLINFIFTGCRSVCPTQTAILRDVKQRWTDLPAGQSAVLLISITVDPKHDGPQQLRDYARRFDIDPGMPQGWVFVTGETREINTLLSSFSSRAAQPADHSNVVWVGNEPRRRWSRAAALNTPPQIAQLLREILQ
ncbi:MAG: exported protein of unknown function [Nitrospira sp.]|nr:SCO family protein [Nitrospira sp.]ULA61232.1 MAG: exported protein of unknown function [Nitrospira sp.]